ncbi:MAG: hypothetical protein HQ546_10460 [Planctomycetes bacterium]|nr:hypothetical protein [Planctomycetota bacterium]
MFDLWHWKSPPRPPKQGDLIGRPSLWRRLRVFATVAVVSVLTWVWADLESSHSEDVWVRLKVVAPQQSSLRIISPDPQGLPIRITCHGPQGTLSEFLRQLRTDAAGGSEPACIVQANPAWEQKPGGYSLDVLDVLNKWDRLRGLTANAPSRRTIIVKVDRWEPIEAAVRLHTSDDAALASKPMISPPKVKILVPSSYRQVLGSTPVIETEELDLDGLALGQDISKTAQLSKAISGVPVKLLGETEVTVTFRISERTKIATLQVNVELLASAEVWEQVAEEGLVLYRKEPSPLGPWRPNLKIKGPRTEIDKANANPGSLRAFVRITNADLQPVSWLSRKVDVILPTGLTLQEPTELTVQFRFDKPDNPPAK